MGESTDSEPDLVLDCLGMLCPQPIIELGRAYGRVGRGGLIALLADDAAADADVPAWCRLRGQELVSVEPVEKGTRYLVRRL